MQGLLQGGKGVILFGCNDEPKAIYELVYNATLGNFNFSWQKLPQKLKYSTQSTLHPPVPAILIPEDMTTCKISEEIMIQKFYLEIIGIPVVVLSVFLLSMYTIYYVVYQKKRNFNEESVLQNIFEVRSNKNLDIMSQKNFENEKSNLITFNINQIIKGNQIGNIYTK